MCPWWKCAVWLLLFTHTLFHRHQFFSLCSVEVGLFLNTPCVLLQNVNDTERQYTLIRSKMNIHKMNISSLQLVDQLLHVDVNMFYPNVKLRLFPIAVFFQWVSLSLTHAYSYVVSFIISWLMHIRVQWDVLCNTCIWQVTVSLRISVTLK